MKRKLSKRACKIIRNIGLAVVVVVGLVTAYGFGATRQSGMSNRLANFSTDNAGIAGGLNSNSYSNSYDESSAVDIDSSSKVVKDSYFNLDTTKYDDVMDDLKKIAKNNDGVFSSNSESVRTSNDYYYDYYTSKHDSGDKYRVASLSIRVPSEKFSDVFEQISNLKNVSVVSKQCSAYDVEDDYKDVQSRLDNAKKRLARYQELLEKADSMDDMITLEDHMNEVQSEIDSYSQDLNDIDADTKYSTVSINMTEVKSFEMTQNVSFGRRLMDSFTDGFSSFGDTVGDIVLFIAHNFLWLLIAIIVVLYIRKKRLLNVKHVANKIAEENEHNE